jgi:hypothetical protein
MRDIHRNPILYYLLIPVLIGMWPLLVWGVYLPATQRDCDKDHSLLVEAQMHIISILEIDPDRINPADSNRVVGEFAYGKAVDSTANLCGIPAGNCRFSAGDIMNVSGKRRRDAMVKLKDIGIVQIAKFLSYIQSTWVNLQCDEVKLTRRKGMPDQWDVDLSFIYYY